MASIILNKVAKQFGQTVAVDNVNLNIRRGELFFLLGPSGCGKTTLLRILAGFVDPTAGTVMFNDRDVTHVPPNKRNTGMVFQSYALFPHMTVAENVAYGLRIRDIPVKTRNQQVREALEVVHMAHLATRKPNSLSGGEQQRVALARAIVVEPDVLLLDEPLSNLDAKLRLEMRSEIRRICTTLGITTVYVTHDQKEALSIADRIAIMHQGRIEQIGTPLEIYQQPNSSFVAAFLGETNFIDVKVASDGLETPFGLLKTAHHVLESKEIVCSIRPEVIEMHSSPATHNSFSGTCIDTVYLGDVNQHLIQVADNTTLRVLQMNPAKQLKVGDTVHLSVNPENVIPLPK